MKVANKNVEFWRKVLAGTNLPNNTRGRYDGKVPMYVLFFFLPAGKFGEMGATSTDINLVRR